MYLLINLQILFYFMFKTSTMWHCWSVINHLICSSKELTYCQIYLILWVNFPPMISSVTVVCISYCQDCFLNTPSIRGPDWLILKSFVATCQERYIRSISHPYIKDYCLLLLHPWINVYLASCNVFNLW